MNEAEIRVLVVDDHPVVLEGLTSGLKQYPGISIVGSAVNVSEARQAVENCAFDLVVLDLNLPNVFDGLELIRFLRSRVPDCKIVVLTYSSRPEDVFEANQAGAHAYLIKDIDLDEIAEAFFTVQAGGRPPLKPELEAALWQKLREVPPDELPFGLSEREWKILRLMTRGYTNDEISQKLFVSPRVVRRCNTSIYGKLSVRNRSEAIGLALRENLFS